MCLGRMGVQVSLLMVLVWVVNVFNVCCLWCSKVVLSGMWVVVDYGVVIVCGLSQCYVQIGYCSMLMVWDVVVVSVVCLVVLWFGCVLWIYGVISRLLVISCVVSVVVRFVLCVVIVLLGSVSVVICVVFMFSSCMVLVSLCWCVLWSCVVGYKGWLVQQVLLLVIDIMCILMFWFSVVCIRLL